LDIGYFFKSNAHKELAASAFLATLLDGNEAFRRAFLARAKAVTLLDDSREWVVSVEDPRTRPGNLIDVSLDDRDSAFVLIENKIQAGSIEPHQLLRYYEDAALLYPERQIVALLLTPDRRMGDGQVKEVRASRTYRDRLGRPKPDVVEPLGWTDDVKVIVEGLGDEDGGLAASGMLAVEEVIDTRRPPLEFDEQRQVVRDAVEAAGSELQDQFTDTEVAIWHSRANSEIVTYHAPFTASVVASFTLGPDKKPVDLFDPDGSIRLVSLTTRFNLSVRGRKVPAAVAEWERFQKAGQVTNGGIVLDLHHRTFIHEEKGWSGSEQELTAQMRERGRIVLDFLGPRLRMPIRVE
jgi:PD-(D/E)XK nuclease superfamily